MLHAFNDHHVQLTNVDSPVLIAVSPKLNEVTGPEEGEEEGCVRPARCYRSPGSVEALLDMSLSHLSIICTGEILMTL